MCVYCRDRLNRDQIEDLKNELPDIEAGSGNSSSFAIIAAVKAVLVSAGANEQSKYDNPTSSEETNGDSL